MTNTILLFLLGGIIGSATAVYVTTRTEEIPLIEFVKRTDLDSVLKAYDIKMDKNIRCIVCDDTITADNLGMIVPQEHNNFFVCSRNRCMTINDVIIEDIICREPL